MKNVHALLYRILDSFFRHRWLFVLSLITVTGVTTTTLYLRSKTFTATAQTQILSTPEELAAAAGQAQGYSWISPSQRQVTAFNDLMNDNDTGGFLDKALQGADIKPPINVDPRADDPRLAKLRKSLSAHPVSDTIFAIDLVWSDDRECERIVRSLQQQFIEFVGQNKQARSLSIGTFLKTTLSQLSQKMERAERVMSEYQRKHTGLTSDEQQAQTERLSVLIASRDELKSDSDGNDRTVKSIQEQLKNIAPEKDGKRTVEFVSNDKLALRATLEAEKVALLAHGHTPESDAVQIKVEQLADLDKKIKAESRATRTTIVTKGKEIEANPRYDKLTADLDKALQQQSAYRASLKQMNDDIANYQVRQKQLLDENRQLMNYKRDYENLRTEYNDIWKRSQNSDLSAEIEKIGAATSLHPIGMVYAEGTTGKSKMIIMFVTSLLLGLLVALIMVIIGEWSDPTLRYESETSALHGIPVIGIIEELNEIRALPAIGIPSTA